jgi:hypothetical protein
MHPLRGCSPARLRLGHKAGRVDHIQHVLSDPRDVPLDALDRKSALGAYDRWSEERRS